MKALLKKSLSRIARLMAKIIDIYQTRDGITPPRNVISVVDRKKFKETGQLYFRNLVDIGGLEPDMKVLDVGCGIGRVARCLTGYLEKGSYDGFDIVNSQVEWCTKHISAKYPNFRFQTVDIYNGVYNPEGAIDPKLFKFPYASDFFDFAFLTSVFTHMLPEEVNNYLSEIRRVLKQNGRFFITVFLINERSRLYMQEGKSSRNFKYNVRGYDFCFSDEQTHQGWAIAYQEKYILGCFEKHGLQVVHPIHYGTWYRSRNQYPKRKLYQDVIVGVK